MHVLNNEKIVVEGLQIVGIHYRDSVNDDHFRKTIRQAALDRSQAGILLTHAPDRVNISEKQTFLPATLRTHARWADVPVHTNRIAHVWSGRLRLAAGWQADNLYIVRRGYVGASAARGNQSGGCVDPVGITLDSAQSFL